MAISKKSIKRRLWRGCREKGTLQHCWASLVAQRLKHLPGMLETWVWSLGREDPLEKEMATHSSILAWRIPWREEPGRLQSMGSQRVGHDWATSLTHPLTHSNTVGGSVNWYNHHGEQYGGSLKRTWEHISGENSNSKRCMHPHVYSSVIYSNQDLEATYVLTDRQMDKEDTVYTSTAE